MSAELELAEDQAISVFSARRVRARLRTEGERPVTVFRATLEWGKKRLFSMFHEGTPTDSLVRARAHLIDEVLHEAWLQFLPEDAPNVVLIAVGGYGRSELLPYSDIDLLALHDSASLATLKAPLEQFFAFLWDIGLEVGSGVRTVDECAALAAEDLTVITNLMESRYLVGDARLYADLQSRITPDQQWPVDEFFRAKLEEQRARYRKYDDTAYKLEPNVKEGPGGLRDIQTIAWVTRRHFGQSSLTELRNRGFLTKPECDELFAGQDFLWRVRFALHMIANRHEDRLLFDNQIKLAELFGYIDQDHNKAVEQFMQLYYRTIKSLSCLNDMLLQLFEEAILGRGGDEPAHTLNPRFQVRGRYIEASNDDVFVEHPTALLEVFALLARHPELEGIRAATIRMIRRDGRLIEAHRNDIRARALFIGLFQDGDGLTNALRRMNRYGVLGRYLPAFGHIVGHMQYDLFHTLTVDEHSLHLVRNLRRMAMPQFKDELPFYSQVIGRIPRPELLYIAGLFHDLAKGRGGDHSELGAVDAEAFCLDHGLSHADAKLVGWLVRSHLMMSLTAQRQDISNPEIVTAFARRVGNREYLDHLLLLTVADIRATNPALWNSWRDNLLRDLYQSTTRTLERGFDNPVSEAERVAELQRAALVLLGPHGVDAQKAQTIWAHFEADYFLRHSPAELAWHLPAIAEATDDSLPLILVDAQGGSNSTTAFIYTRDRDHLFGLATGVLAMLGLNILDARINTTADGYVLDSFVVIESDGVTGVDARHRHAEIRDKLRKVIADPAVSVVDVNRRRSTRLKHFDTPTTVHFRQDLAHSRTILELVAADQPGLLSLLGRIFHKRGILLEAAKIATIGERAEDVFFITDRAHRPISDEHLLAELREVVTRTFDNNDPVK